jgi:hypothetical protein
MLRVDRAVMCVSANIPLCYVSPARCPEITQTSGRSCLLYLTDRYFSGAKVKASILQIFTAREIQAYPHPGQRVRALGYEVFTWAPAASLPPRVGSHIKVGRGSETSASSRGLARVPALGDRLFAAGVTWRGAESSERARPPGALW